MASYTPSKHIKGLQRHPVESRVSVIAFTALFAAVTLLCDFPFPGPVRCFLALTALVAAAGYVPNTAAACAEQLWLQ